MYAGLARVATDSVSANFMLDSILVSIGLQTPTSSLAGSDNKSLLLLRISVPATTNDQV